MLLKHREYEEKLGQVVKEKKNLEDKERILLNTFEALKQLEELKSKKQDRLPGSEIYINILLLIVIFVITGRLQRGA